MDAIYSVFACLNCTKYLAPPVQRCFHCGLDMCPRCSSELEYCPRCLGDKDFQANTALDHVLKCIVLPCRRQWCFYEAICTRVRRHEEVCPHKIKLCPLRHFLACDWFGNSKNQLVRHCKVMHSERVVVTNTHMFRFFNFKECFGSGEKKHCLIYFDAYHEFFHFYQCYDFVDCLIKWKMCFNGERFKMNKFSFEVIFEDFNDKTKKVFQAPCQFLRDQEFYYFDFLTVRFFELSDFCAGNDLIYTVKIKIA